MCAFLARPNLDNTQFKQLKSSELTLSGQTQIATTSGLTLATGSTGGVIITASGAGVDNQVLTYDLVENLIKLKDPTASGGTGIYTCTSPSTCTVGGLPSGSVIYGSGITSILECILAPLIAPVIIIPNISAFSLHDDCGSNILYEMGTQLSLSGCTCFCQGTVDPFYSSYGGSSTASGLPYEYDYTSVFFPAGITCSTSDLTPLVPLGTVTIGAASTPFYSCVSYLSGGTGDGIIYDSAGSVVTCSSSYYTTYQTGTTSASQRVLTGTYPIYYGSVTGATRPTVTQDLITGGTKVVEISTGTVTVDFLSDSTEYTWVAIPSGATNSKYCWHVSASSNGIMNSTPIDPTNKYPDECIISVTSAEGCWSSINYKVYMSKAVGEIILPMDFCN